MPFAPSATVLDPARAVFLRDVIAGLSRKPRSLPCKYFYDARGSELFEEITRLPEYYLTRSEIAILEAHGEEMAAVIGSGALLIELGSGSSTKTRILLDRLPDLAAYVPIDISEEHLYSSAEGLAADYPNLQVVPVAADYSAAVTLPEMPEHRRKVAFFPGSTIGNFPPAEALAFLRRIAGFVGPGGGLLIGADLPKDGKTLELAYDDPAGVTAEFNLNLLARINRELDGTFEPEHWRHLALWNPHEPRMEMYLVSESEQQASVAGHRFSFAQGQRIHTEYSYKYARATFEELARSAGFSCRDCWLDEAGAFSVHYLEAASKR